ncbi:MAG: hypothetical protein ACI37Q_03320 [Candidatus Gastranaerophilaceae bacterium]
MEKNDVIGAAQIAGGSYLGYQGLKHGLPRAAGIRIEYHTTSKENAQAIKRVGNILDPAYGGKNGWSQKVRSEHFVKNSERYIHLTGINKDTPMLRGRSFKKYPFLKAPFATLYRKGQNIMYQTVGNVDTEELKSLMGGDLTKGQRVKWIFKKMFNQTFSNKTKRFCIPGIDSYFDKEFIPDTDDIALKSSKPIRAYNNRFSAMMAGLKKFGLKGIKENKGRVAFGVGLLALGVYGAVKLISKGIDNIRK